jgi:hypothetical protein
MEEHAVYFKKNCYTYGEERTGARGQENSLESYKHTLFCRFAFETTIFYNIVR